MTSIFFSLIFLSTLLLATASPLGPPNSSPSPDSSGPGCVDELVAISPCLGYVAAEPNNVTDTITSQCCDAFSKAFNSRDGNCFCYLVNQPLIFGFPLNEARVLSLPTVCTSRNGSVTTEVGVSMASICSESPPLPPLQGSTGVEISKPPALDTFNGSSPSASRPTSESVQRSPTAAAQPKPTRNSSTVKHICNWFLLEALLFLAIYFVN